MEYIIFKMFVSKMTGQNDRQDESLTGHVHDQAGHYPLTGRYFEPWVLLDLGQFTALYSLLRSCFRMASDRAKWSI